MSAEDAREILLTLVNSALERCLALRRQLQQVRLESDVASEDLRRAEADLMIYDRKHKRGPR